MLSEWLEIDPRNLHRIELENIRLADEAERNLNAIISRMIDEAQPLRTTAGELLSQIDDLIDCRGFWLESSRDLLLYVQVWRQIKTILIPSQLWSIQHTATIH